MLLKTQAKYVCGFSIWVLRCRTQRSYGDVAPLLLSLMLVEVALKLFRPMPVVIKTEFEDVAVVAVSTVAPCWRRRLSLHRHPLAAACRRMVPCVEFFVIVASTACPWRSLSQLPTFVVVVFIVAKSACRFRPM